VAQRAATLGDRRFALEPEIWEEVLDSVRQRPIAKTSIVPRCYPRVRMTEQF
jgi:hypothetical protein